MSSPAGWHTDPSDPRVQRYWDGFGWKAQRMWDGARWVEFAPATPPSPTNPAALEPPPWQDTGPASTPPSTERGASPGNKVWYILAGVAATLIVLIAVAVAASRGGGGGDGGGGGGGQNIDYGQFQSDVEVNYVALKQLDGYDLNQDDFGAYPILPSDCRDAATDLRTLRAHTNAWPAVLRAPMSQAETEFAAAITACSASDFTTMKADMTKGDGYLTATQNAFDKHCTQSDQDVMRWQC